jgi:hypothetical protein
MKCFIISFKKIAVVGIESPFYQIPEMLRTAPKAYGCDLPMGQRQHPAMRVLRSGTRPRSAAFQESLANRKEYRHHCPVRSQDDTVLWDDSSQKPAVDQKAETLGQLSPIEWPDEDGFYSSLVLRQVRARFQPGRKLNERGCSPSDWKTVDQSVAAQGTKSAFELEAILTTAKVACSGTSREPLETLLAELAQRHVQTPALRGACS